MVIHGLYGSELRSPKSSSSLFGRGGSVKWMSTGTVLSTFLFRNSSGHPGLAHPLLGLGQDDLETADLLMSYKGWQKFAFATNKSGKARVLHYLWDFRRPVQLAVDGFDAFMDGLASSGVSPITLVTHSTGSMIAFPVINKRPSLFSSWFSVGGAIGPGPSALYDLNVQGRGFFIDHPLPTTLISATTLATFPPLFGFLSQDSTCLVDDSTGEPVPGNLYDVEDWVRLKLGPWSRAADTTEPCVVSDDLKAHIKECLSVAQLFRRQLDDGHARLVKPASDYRHLKIFCYGVDHTPTVSKVRWSGARGSALRNEGHAETTPGDGTVQGVNWRKIPCDLPSVVVFGGNSAHSELPNEEKLHDLVLKAAMNNQGGEGDTRI